MRTEATYARRSHGCFQFLLCCLRSRSSFQNCISERLILCLVTLSQAPLKSSSRAFSDYPWFGLKMAMKMTRKGSNFIEPAGKKTKLDVDDFDINVSDEFKCYHQLYINMKLEKCLSWTIVDCKNLISERADQIKHAREKLFENEHLLKKIELLKAIEPISPCMELLKQINEIHSRYSDYFQNLSSRINDANGAILSPYEDWDECMSLFEECLKSIDKDNLDKVKYALNNIEDIKYIAQNINVLSEECRRMLDSIKNRKLLLNANNQ
jgi:hypothetical protein